MKALESDNWNFYLTNIDLNIASVCLDLEAKNTHKIEDYPNLCWLFIQLKIEHDDGLSDDKEFDDLCAYEKILKKHIASKPIAYVGRITTQGMRQFYFYTSRSFAAFREAVNQVTQEDPSYQYRYGSQKDIEWLQYDTVLYPSKEELEQIASRPHLV